MAKIHVLENDRVVFHFPVPAGSNAAGVAWCMALVQSGLGGASAMTEGQGAGLITLEELNQIKAGEVAEVVATLPLASAPEGEPVANFLAERWVQMKDELTTGLRTALKHYGMIRG